MRHTRTLLALMALSLMACQPKNVRPENSDMVQAPAIECQPTQPQDPEVVMPEDAVSEVPPDSPAVTVDEVTLESLGTQLALIDAKLQDLGSRIAPPQTTSRPVTEPKPVACPEVPESDHPASGKTLLGTLEWIWLDPPGRAYRARVDSGANTSSISALNVREFERDGKEWVRFTFDHDGEEPEAMIERPVERVVLIRQVSASEPERRPVVLLTVRLGDLVQKTEFTLTDRTEMTYPVLLGREFLRDLYLIDVAQSYLQGKPKKR